jgi:methionyl-tRNA formyltransferase
LRVAFAGTPPFAARALEALDAAGHEFVLVLSQPDRPAGRGMKISASAVALLARAHGFPLEQPENLKSESVRESLRRARAEVMVVAAYGIILPQAVLDIPDRGCLNIHASLLPRWRGAAPVQRAILAGDDQTGVCIMRMDAGLDTGPVLLRKSLAIGPRDTAGSLTQRLAVLGSEAIVEALQRLPDLQPVPQDSAPATYAAKIEKSEARIDWGRDAREIDRQVRAFNPFPGAETLLEGSPLKIWDAEPVPGSGDPGTVIGHIDGRPVVACGNDALALTTAQKAGAKRLPISEFIRGQPLPEGLRLGS